MDEQDIHQLTAAYALDALDPDEERAYEEHLAGCPDCREELVAFRETAGSLALAAPPAAPPSALHDRILDTVHEERATVVPFRRRLATPLLGGIAAAAAAAALALGLYALDLRSDVSALKSSRQSAQTAAQILASPNARQVAVSSGGGTLVVAPSGAAALVLPDLGPAPEGKAYEAWVIEGETPRPAGVFDATRGATVVPLTTNVPGGATVAVTVEREGGVDEPTTDPILTARS